MFKKILVPVDGSELSDVAVKKAEGIAKAFGSEIVLMHVIEMTAQDYPSNPYKFSRDLIDRLKRENTARSEKILSKAKKDLSDIADKISVHSVEGLPYMEIVEYGEEIGADLIIIGSSGTSGIRNMLGSIARKVAITSKKPVLIVR